VMRPWREEEVSKLEGELGELRDELRDRFEEDGMDPKEMTFAYRMDLRYVGQSHELSVSVALDAISRVGDLFHDLHRRRYGHAEETAPVEVVTLRVRGLLPAPALMLPELSPRGPEDSPAALEEGVYLRERIRGGDRVEGPAVILEDFHTVVVPAGWVATPDRVGNLMGSRLEGGGG